MSVDYDRGLVFVPTGSATPDFFGKDRAGTNLFANTLLALDASTGERHWEFDPFVAGAEVRQGGTSRGVTYWADGDDRRIFATGGSKLFALNANTGRLIDTFGTAGVVDLHDGLDAGRDVSDLFIISNTPGII